MKKLLACLLAVLLLLSAASAEETDWDFIREKGTLVVGITDYAPMDYRDKNGEWTGFDAEFARLVGEKLGVAVTFIEINWDNKFFELNARTIDCIWNGMTITDEVLLNSACTNPYVKNAQVVVAKADRAAKLTSPESLSGLLFAVEAGSAGEAALKDLGVTDYTACLDQASALMEVAAGTADACVIDITMANAMTGEGTSYAALAKALELTSEEYGIGFRKGSDMVEKVNGCMAELLADGTLDALAAKYELTLVKAE